MKSESVVKPVYAAYLKDDWSTSGDWVGRYGRQFAILFAAMAPCDDVFSTPDYKGYSVGAELGSRATDHDEIRRWLAEVKSKDSRALYDPEIASRVFGEVDDHGEVYPADSTGPDVWLSLEIPSGLHRVSLYFVNNDGHSGRNRFRNLNVEVKTYTSDSRTRNESQPITSCRVTNFYGGVFKQFTMSGPNRYLIRIQRNGLNSMISGVFIDKLSQNDRDAQTLMPAMGYVRYQAPRLNGLPTLSARCTLADQLWKAVQSHFEATGDPQLEPYRWEALRAVVSEHAPQRLILNWYWNLEMWDHSERLQFEESMKGANDSFLSIQNNYTDKYISPPLRK